MIPGKSKPGPPGTLFRGFDKNCVDLDYESRHNHDRPQRKSHEAEAMRLTIQRHNDEAYDERDHTDDHPLIVLFAKRKFVVGRSFAFHVCVNQYSSSKDMRR